MNHVLRAAGSMPREVPGIRVRGWHLDPDLAHLALPTTARPPLQPVDLRTLVGQLRNAGYRGAVTAALGPADQLLFAEAGFRIVERLHLLRRRLDRPINRIRVTNRRGRRRDHRAILAVDQAAFPPFWRLDRHTLNDALAATRRARLRVLEHPRGEVVAYAVCGRSGSRGYVQRLAVHPDHQSKGYGAALLGDGLAWMRRWGARDAVVNTQVDNARSLQLYRRAGFRLQPVGLAVLRIDIDPESRAVGLSVAAHRST